MLSLILRLIPNNYKWSVATKNIGIGLGKIATSLLAGSFGKQLAQEHIEAVGVVVTIMSQAGLEFAHDWLKMKFPNSKWL